MSFSKKYITNSSEETKKIAEDFVSRSEILLRSTKTPRIIALFGELGSGKTTFVQGLAKGLGVKKRIISPTFIIMRKYNIPKDILNFYHVDLYRIEANINELSEIGISEIMKVGKDIIAIEWAGKLGKLLPRKRIKVYFEYLSENKRQIKIVYSN